MFTCCAQRAALTNADAGLLRRQPSEERREINAMRKVQRRSARCTRSGRRIIHSMGGREIDNSGQPGSQIPEKHPSRRKAARVNLENVEAS